MSVPPSKTGFDCETTAVLSGPSESFDENGPLARWLEEAARRRASDLLLIADAAPTVSADGQWTPLDEHPLAAEDIAACLYPILSVEQRERLHTNRDLDMALTMPRLGRIRLNIHYQRGQIAAAIRMIPDIVPAFEQLSLPQQTLRFADFPGGLVLVAGGTGQGKSTTLAALIDHMNRTRDAHVITIEDPIEFAFQHGSCLIEQRQVGDDAPSFASALRHVLRQRPDVILIGELRDQQTMATALTAAETGHLVLSTLHTAGAARTLARLIDAFPADQQQQVRTQLAASLQAILCQTLLPDRLNGGLVPATELLFSTPGVRRAVRDDETHLIYSMLETGRCHGMHTLEQSLEALVKAGRVAPQEAVSAATDPARLKKMIAHHLQRDSIVSDDDSMLEVDPMGMSHT